MTRLSFLRRRSAVEATPLPPDMPSRAERNYPKAPPELAKRIARLKDKRRLARRVLERTESIETRAALEQKIARLTDEIGQAVAVAKGRAAP
jgi:hypothetical protein